MIKRFFASISRGLIRVTPDKSDFFLFVGMGLLFYGIYQYLPPVAFIVIGCLAIGIAYLSAGGKK